MHSAAYKGGSVEFTYCYLVEHELSKRFSKGKIIMAKIKITQVKSTIDRLEKQKRTVKALGLRHPNHSVVRENNPQTLGMINVVKHLVNVEEISE